MKNFINALFIAVLLSSNTAKAGLINLNDFFTTDPEIVISVDGSSADFVESMFTSFISLINDPFSGDANVVAPALSRTLTMDYDFIEAVGNDDLFSVFLFDSDLGLFAGTLDFVEFELSAAGTLEFDLSSHVGLNLGLSIELVDQSLQGTESTLSIANLKLNDLISTVPPITVSAPPTFALFAISVLGCLLLHKFRIND
jgi:hypothetical protein